jgi:ubiquitin-protein ligase
MEIESMPRWLKRVRVELEKEKDLLNRGEKEGVTFMLDEEMHANTDSDGGYDSPIEQFKNLIGYIKGPPETPYADGIFKLAIEVGTNYPLQPPKMRFITIPWHPNVGSQTGAICIDILKSGEWSPMMHIRSSLLSLQCLLQAPNADDPQDAVVAQQYLNQTHLWERTAKEWTSERALPSSAMKNIFSPAADPYTPIFRKISASVKKCRNKNVAGMSTRNVGGGSVLRDREECSICLLS